MERQRKQWKPKPVTEISSKPRGCPPLLLEVDTKLIVFLNAVWKRGGVVNCHVVCATAKALIESAESGTVKQNLSQIDLPRTWLSPFTYARNLTEEWQLRLDPLYYGDCTMDVETISFVVLIKQSSNTRYHQSLCSILIRCLHCMYQWAGQPCLLGEQSQWQ